MHLIGVVCIVLAGSANAGFSSSQTATSNSGGYDPSFQPPIQPDASGYTYSYASPNAVAYAHSFLGSDNYLRQNLGLHQQLQQQALEHAAAIQAQVQQSILDSQANFGNTLGGGSNYAGSASYGGIPNYASGTASIGPDGIHHSGFINPPNPASPNFDTRFDGDTVVGGGPGSYGVSSTSFSSSSNVDGVENNKRGTITTVNDNGKVTTYETHS